MAREITGRVVLEKCPVCRRAPVKSVFVKELFGILGTREKIQCQNKNCGATFERKEAGTLRLIPSARFVNRYEGEVLTIREWRRIADGGLSDAEEQLAKIKKGELPTIPAEQLDIILKKGEVAHLQGTVEYWEERMVRRHAGSFGGPSFRIAKGVYWRMGRYSGSSRSYPELRHIDTGNLVLTSKRLVFTGELNSFTIPLAKIASLKMNGKSDLVINKEGKSKPFHIICNAEFLKVFILGAVSNLNKNG